MKLYSRRQVVFISLGSILAVCAVLFFTGVLDFKTLRGNEAVDTFSGSIDAIQEGTIAQQADPSIEEMKPVRTGDSTYNEDELNSIQVYEALNEGVVNITTETLALNWFLEPVPQEG
ncbi:MAG TPA: peptidase S1, partial [Spirochaetia bacterium]|nr:peptidase S1 [Spirochaetia bacterium]